MGSRSRARRRRVAALGMALTATAAVAQPEAEGGFETPALLQARDVAPAALLEGPGFVVEDAAPSDGFLTRFTIRADAGLFEAHGVETLALRVGELAALHELARVRASSLYARAAAAVAARGFDPVAGSPSATSGPPAGLASGIEGWLGAPVASAAEPAGGSGGERAAGFEMERRKAAQRLRVDPYTTNAALAVALDDFAWAAWAGGLPRSSLVAPPGAGYALPGGPAARQRVYEAARAELIEENGQRMRDLGASEEQVRALAATPAVSLSMQTALLDALDRLGEVDGRADVLSLAATARTPAQVLFLVRAAGILADRREQANVAALLARGTLVARREDGGLLAPIPADLLAWTEPLARFAQREDLVADERAIWITGRASSLARDRLEAVGWAVFEGVKP